MKYSLNPLVMGDLSIPIPIIQGGMGVKISTAPLVSAVANAGGAGTIASIALGLASDSFSKDFSQAAQNALRDEIRLTRTMTDGVIGVNILTALTLFEKFARIASAEDINYIVAGAGIPLRLPEYVENKSIKLIPIISSARVAHIIMKSWLNKHNRLPDALLIEGPLAGGHLGFSRQEIIANTDNALETILKDVLTLVAEFEKRYNKKIPVIVAGGIFTGKDIAHFIQLGASAVQMGTRFVATDECAVPDEFKQKYINATDEDLVILDSPVGLPGRAIRTRFTDQLSQGAKEAIMCNYQCLRTCDPKHAPYCIARALVNAVDPATIENSVVFAGRNVTRVKKIVPVKTLMEELVREAIQSLREGEDLNGK
jgi:nitronate monooxygenase